MTDQNTQPDLIAATLREAIDTATDDAGREQAREALGQHIQARRAQEAPKSTAGTGIPLLEIDPRLEAQRQAEGKLMLDALQASPGVTRGVTLGLLGREER